MNELLFTTGFIFLFSSTIFSQNFQGEAIYEFKLLRSKKITQKIENTTKSNADIVDDKLFEEALAKASLKKFKFLFDATTSTFEEMQELEKPKLGSEDFQVSISFNKGVLFKNLKTKQSIEESFSFDDKKYLVQDNLPTYDWKITSETKKIGNYNCLKATAIIKVTEKQLKEYQERQKKKKSLTSFLNKAPEDTMITAWFTSEIPVSNGPAEFGGLPGLILELTAGEILYICSKITINPKNKLVVAEPKKGKPIAKEIYEEQQASMYKKMANEDGVIIHEMKQ